MHLRRRQANQRTLLDRTSQRHPFRPRPIVSTLDTLKLLHQPDGRVACLCERELFCLGSAFGFQPRIKSVRHTADTDPGTAVEWQVLPPRSQRLPSLRLEFFRIFAVKVFPAVHGVD